MGSMKASRNTSTGRTVGEVAELARVTVRTLHHYDAIGLLRPSERTSAGYRVYSDDDLRVLRRIMFYRELGFSLDDVAAILSDTDETSGAPGSDTSAHLHRQHEAVLERIAQLHKIATAIECELEATQMDLQLTPEEQFEVFGSDYRQEWSDEAEQRWGETDAYRESRRRTRTYTKADWVQIQAEAAAIDEAFVAAVRSGVPADSAVARELGDRHRAHISRWFYDCTVEIHHGLAEMYVADDRFRARYEALEPGLAQYLRDAICTG